MPWNEVTVVSGRLEFVLLAMSPGANRRAPCARFGISRRTGYKWIERYRRLGEDGLENQSRRPHSSPARSDDALEQRVVQLRDTYPDWGSRKLRALLRGEGFNEVPAASTITEILRRHGRLDPLRAGEPHAWKHFEHEAPNQLWQMDFKGDFPLTDMGQSRCHAFTVIDDHSRFGLCLRACANERQETVQEALTSVFRRYGLPLRITADNGSPWGNSNTRTMTAMGAWLARLGVRLSHSSPFHPQTQGKDERFHRTFKKELLSRQGFASLASAQAAFDAWRDRYNLIRPHDAIGLATPATRYQPSARVFPEVLPAVEYDSADIVRRVQAQGQVHFRGKMFKVGSGLAGMPVALRAVEGEQSQWDIYFCHQRLARVSTQTEEEIWAN